MALDTDKHGETFRNGHTRTSLECLHWKTIKNSSDWGKNACGVSILIPSLANTRRMNEIASYSAGKRLFVRSESLLKAVSAVKCSYVYTWYVAQLFTLMFQWQHVLLVVMDMLYIKQMGHKCLLIGNESHLSEAFYRREKIHFNSFINERILCREISLFSHVNNLRKSTYAAGWHCTSVCDKKPYCII